MSGGQGFSANRRQQEEYDPWAVPQDEDPWTPNEVQSNLPPPAAAPDAAEMSLGMFLEGLAAEDTNDSPHTAAERTPCRHTVSQSRYS